MFLLPFLRHGLQLLLPLSVALTTWLYLYPVWHGCAFPLPDSRLRQSRGSNGDDGARYSATGSPFLTTLRQHVRWGGGGAEGESGGLEKIMAPFRLLALGDPQLEGDTSIPDPNALSFPAFFKTFSELVNTDRSLRQRLRHSIHAAVDFWLEDIPTTINAQRKRLDLIGNDYYLAHIYRTLHWWTFPTHVSVLGDLVGSQWISDEEFEVRGARYWNRVFKGGERVPDHVTNSYVPGESVHGQVRTFTLGGDDKERWKNRVINIAGNHDIGYAGDLTPERFERFERVFGRANYEVRFRLPRSSLPKDDPYNTEGKEVPELRVIVLNDMNLDTPAGSKDLQDATYRFVNDVIEASPHVERPALFTLLLTHIPLHKIAGVCVDAPYFAFHDTEEFGYGVQEQNHLSDVASKGLLEGIFGMSGDAQATGKGIGRHGMIVNGHDHEGCDVWHFINQTEPETANLIPIPESDNIQEDFPADRSEVLNSAWNFDDAKQNENKESDVTVSAIWGQESGESNTAVPTASDANFGLPEQMPLNDTPEAGPEFSAPISSYPETLESETSSAKEPQILEQEIVDVPTRDSQFDALEVSFISNIDEESLTSTHSQDDTRTMSDFGPTPEAIVSEQGAVSLEAEEPAVFQAEETLSEPEPSIAVEFQSESSIDSPEISIPSINSPEIPVPSVDSDDQLILGRAAVESGVREHERSESIAPISALNVESWLSSAHDSLVSKASYAPAKSASEETVPEWIFLSVEDPTVDIPVSESNSESEPVRFVPEPWKPSWSAFPYKHALRGSIPAQRRHNIPGIREATLRSMMGEFSGHAGLLSLWFDTAEWEWKSEIADCGLGKQHWWWVVHIVDLICVIGIILFGATYALETTLRMKIEIPVELWFAKLRLQIEERLGLRPKTVKELEMNGGGIEVGVGKAKMRIVDEAQLLESLRRHGWIVKKSISSSSTTYSDPLSEANFHNESESGSADKEVKKRVRKNKSGRALNGDVTRGVDGGVR